MDLSLLSLDSSFYPSTKIKIDEFLLEWLNINETNKLIDYLLDEASSRTSEGYSTLHSDIQNVNPPPRSPNSSRSPKKRLQSEISSQQEVKGNEKYEGIGHNHHHEIDERTDNQSTRRRSNIDSLPVFFVKGRGHKSRKPITEGLSESTVYFDLHPDQLVLKLSEIESYFKPYPNGIPFENFVHITKGLCGLPSFFNLPLCRRITLLYPPTEKPTSSGTSKSRPAPVSKTVITLKTFLLFWQNEIEPYDRYERFFRLIKQPSQTVNYIIKDDFVPFIQELLHFHPGLEFLENHDEFQRFLMILNSPNDLNRKYALTVIARIYYKVNLSRTGKLSLREIYNSNLIHEFMHVDEETDINRVTEYFSYEHFYVLYCRFFELDYDKDSKLTRDDLLKYGEHSLSEAIVDR
jgi:serine/threonine-protein phosphatase 2A regulatory subunit B''